MHWHIIQIIVSGNQPEESAPKEKVSSLTESLKLNTGETVYPVHVHTCMHIYMHMHMCVLSLPSMLLSVLGVISLVTGHVFFL